MALPCRRTVPCLALLLGTIAPAALQSQAQNSVPAGRVAVPGAAQVLPQDIFTSAPFAQCHASTVVELRNGDWLAAWFGGSHEGADDVAIWGARHTSAGWSAPALLVREPGIAAWNPVLFYGADGTLWLYYKFGPVAAGWTGARMRSRDDGQTWTPTEHLPAGELGPIRAKPLLLGDGTVVSGSSMESYHAWAVWIERSSSDGTLLGKAGPYTLPARSTGSGAEETTGLIQPSVISMGGHHLRYYARSTGNIGRICMADSWDAGVTWTAPRTTELPNPNSGIDAVRLRDGRVVMIYNPVTTGRTPLVLAVSGDGQHFRPFLTLEDEPNAEFSYPALIQLRGGQLLATYTWRRTRIRAVEIQLADVPSGR